MRDRDLEALREHPPFRLLRPRVWRALSREAFLRAHDARAGLVHEGEPTAFLHVVAEGRVELYAAHAGRETTLDILGPGQAFVLAAVVLNEPSMVSARAMNAARLVHLPAEAVRDALGSDALFARCCTEALASTCRGAISDLKDQKLRSGLERLADWLLRHDLETGGTHRFVIPYDKRVLASRLGMAPEVLSRAFAALAPYRVRVRGPDVQLDDLGALQGLAQVSGRAGRTAAGPGPARVVPRPAAERSASPD